MPKSYTNDAIEKCRELYCKYGGKNVEAIEREMKKSGWPLWTKANLFDRGKYGSKNWREGWIDKYGFDNSLRIFNEKLVTKVNSDEQDLYIGIKTVRERLGKVALLDNASKDDLAKYRDFCKLEIEARRNLNLTKDNFETFVSGYEKLLTWAGSIDEQLAKLLVKYGDQFAELAKAHYGKSEDEFDDGTESREDEGGKQPFSLLAGGKDR